MEASVRLRPYVPGFVAEWLREAPAVRHREVDGTLAFVDVSGFTRLTERLAGRGKVGAEEMTDLLDRTFGVLLGIAYSHGAWLVKWGGDAVLLLFQDDDLPGGHAARACTAAVEMRRAMDEVGRLRTSCGPVRLRVSTGVHSGAFDFFLVGSSHRELVITGPGATATARLEAAASAGQVAVSPATAALLPAGLVRRHGADGVLLLTRSPRAAPRPPVRAAEGAGADLGSCLPALTREHLLSGDDEAEHRLVAVAFVEFSGTDALLAAQGPGAATAAVDAVVRTCQDAASRHGVTFWETDISRDGGKVMLVAGAPGSTGADQDALLAVARDVVDAGGVLPVRVGVNSGRVFFGQFGPPYRRTMSVKGDAVNLAARLQV
jgi:class 3 adenylate cyclase